MTAASIGLFARRASANYTKAAVPALPAHPEPPAPRRPHRRLRLSPILASGLILLALAAAIVPALLPGSFIGREAVPIAAGAIFAASYLALAVGRVPGLAIDRAGVALVGAALMVACGAMPISEAYRAIDLDTLTLLLGMMIVVANLRLAGFFNAAGAWALGRARSPLALLATIVMVSGVLSAFLVNDAVCLVLAPLVLELAAALRRNPVPYLLAVAMAANAGSTATITGNPQNMMIGSLSQIPYVRFAAALAPIAAIGLVLTVALIALLHRSEFARRTPLGARMAPARLHRVLMWRALGATALLMALFFAGQPPAKAAIVIGGLLLLTRRVRSERIYAQIDWSLLLMFAGLFIIVAGAERVLLTPEAIAAVGQMHLERVPALSTVTAMLSNLVSNVPAVLVLKPFVESLPEPKTAWLTVAMSSTLAGNLTVIGSIANLIIVQRAAAGGVTIGLWDYCRVGVPLTLLTLAIGTIWLSWRY